MIDVAAERARTPAAGRAAYLNNAGASLPLSMVTEAVIAHLRLESDVGVYEAESASGHAREQTYAAVGDLIGALPEQIALTDSATRSWQGALGAVPVGRDERILVTRAEYASNALAALGLARRVGATVDVVGNDERGQVDLGELERRLATGGVALVALTHVPTSGGLVNPAAEVGALCRAAEVPYLLDACQSVGQLALDVREIGCDFLTATGRKWLRGPRGTGFLYVRDPDCRQPSVVDVRGARWTSADRYELRSGARRFETYERNAAAQIGLGVAAAHVAQLGIAAISTRVSALATRLRTELASIDGVSVHDLGVQQCGIVTFSVAGRDPDDVVTALAAAGVTVSVTGSELAQLDLPARGLRSLVRASPHYFNTDDELDRLLEVLDSPRREGVA